MTVAITDVVLRDAHQSLFATRLRLDDMLPVAAQLDDVGYRSLECWGGATFDACIRFLGEDPWVRLRELKKAMPKTPLQMLLRGQNLLGYRHYADDMVERFVERAVKNGMDVFRVFDAMNDPRNMQAALQAVRRHGAHAQVRFRTPPARPTPCRPGSTSPNSCWRPALTPSPSRICPASSPRMPPLSWSVKSRSAMTSPCTCTATPPPAWRRWRC